MSNFYLVPSSIAPHCKILPRMIQAEPGFCPEGLKGIKSHYMPRVISADKALTIETSFERVRSFSQLTGVIVTNIVDPRISLSLIERNLTFEGSWGIWKVIIIGTLGHHGLFLVRFVRSDETEGYLLVVGRIREYTRGWALTFCPVGKILVRVTNRKTEVQYICLISGIPPEG